MKERKSNWTIAIMVVITMTLIGVVLGQWGGCLNRERAKSWKFEGTVLRLYHDINNHNHATIDIGFNGDTLRKNLLNDQSSLFSELRIGDSIHKERKSLLVDIFRGQEKFSIEMIFECD